MGGPVINSPSIAALKASPGVTAGIYGRFAEGPSGARRQTESVRPSASGPLTDAGYAHDLDDRVAGLRALRNITLGDARITIVILDGNPDLTRSCLRSDRISKVFPFWHKRVPPITFEQHALFREIINSDLPREEKDKRFLAAFSRKILFRFLGDRHATHITSVIAGQRGTPVPGLAPNCRVIVIPLNELGDPNEFISPLNLARAFDLAHDLGADIIHCAACVPTQSDAPHELLARAVRRCLDDNILVVAPAGNNAGDCRCIPAVLPGTLAVGALRDDGRPFKFSNWGGNYSIEGIMAPGERILGAQPGTEEPIREMGTSVAAPIVTGVAALLMSRQLQTGRQIDAAAIAAALLDTARPCSAVVDGQPERCLRGVIDLPSAVAALFGPAAGIGAAAADDRLPAGGEPAAQTTMTTTAVAASSGDAPREPDLSSPTTANVHAAAVASAVRGAGRIRPATAHSGLVYALGNLSYDFGSEARRQQFEQQMSREAGYGDPDRPTSYGVSDLIEYLTRHPAERSHLIWTLVIDGAPVYALKPHGPYADLIHELFLQLFAGQILEPNKADFIERVSIPGRRTGETTQLLSKSEIPVVAVADARGIYGWQTNGLANDAITEIYGAESDRDVGTLHHALTHFLNRVYFDLHNLGQMSRDRAMNFAATNMYQAASVFARAIGEGRILDTIVVNKSPICRLHSDCWDLSLTFFDPENDKRAAQIFQFTIDVSNLMPVTVGDVKSWFQRHDLAGAFPKS